MYMLTSNFCVILCMMHNTLSELWELSRQVDYGCIIYKHTGTNQQLMLVESSKLIPVFFLEVDGSHVHSKLCCLYVSVGISSCFSSKGLII